MSALEHSSGCPPSNATATSIATAHRYVDLISARNLSALPSLFAPNATWFVTGDPSIFPGAGVADPKDRLSDLAQLVDQFDHFSLHLMNIVGVETQAWIEFSPNGTFDDSRLPSYHNTVGTAFTICDGMIEEVREYIDSGVELLFEERLRNATGAMQR